MRSLLRTQTGSVTAEFAVVLPTVLLVAFSLIAGLGLGAIKVQVAGAAGTLARAAGRGEDAAKLAKSLEVQLSVSWKEDFVCVTASKTLLVELQETMCARKGGL